MALRLGMRLRSFWFQPAIDYVGLQLSRLGAVVRETWQHLVADLIARYRDFDRERELDAPEEISRHPIGAGKEHSGLSGILKIKNAAVFKKTADDADDTDILAQVRHFWPQTTDASDDQIDGHLCARNLVQFLDDVLIDQRV